VEPSFSELGAVMPHNWKLHLLKNILKDFDFHLRWEQEMKSKQKIKNHSPCRVLSITSWARFISSSVITNGGRNLIPRAPLLSTSKPL